MSITINSVGLPGNKMPGVTKDVRLFQVEHEILQEIIKQSSSMFHTIHFELNGGLTFGYARYKIMRDDIYLGDITFESNGDVMVTSIIVSKWSTEDLATNLADPNSFKLISNKIKLLLKGTRTSMILHKFTDMVWDSFLTGLIIGSFVTMILLALLSVILR